MKPKVENIIAKKRIKISISETGKVMRAFYTKTAIVGLSLFFFTYNLPPLVVKDSTPIIKSFQSTFKR